MKTKLPSHTETYGESFKVLQNQIITFTADDAELSVTCVDMGLTLAQLV